MEHVYVEDTQFNSHRINSPHSRIESPHKAVRKAINLSRVQCNNFIRDYNTLAPDVKMLVEWRIIAKDSQDCRLTESKNIRNNTT